jgi:hypothetical protein
MKFIDNFEERLKLWRAIGDESIRSSKNLPNFLLHGRSVIDLTHNFDVADE